MVAGKVVEFVEGGGVLEAMELGRRCGSLGGGRVPKGSGVAPVPTTPRPCQT